MLGKLFNKNRRADTTVTGLLWTLVEVVAAITIVIFLIWLGLKFAGFFIGRQDYDSTINNMEALANLVAELAKDSKEIISTTKVFSITDSYVLVGFNYDDGRNMGTDCTQEKIIGSRPRLCQDTACLCIYKNYGSVTDWSGKDFDDKEPKGTALKCRTFDQKILFLVDDTESHNFRGTSSAIELRSKPGNYENLVFYGECGGPWRNNFGIKQLKIEKHKENDKIYIVISEYIEVPLSAGG